MELVKPIVRLGNSAGVVLPKEWLHGEARITLLKKPDNPKKAVLDIIEPYLSSIIGVYLVGSYARGEQKKNSDIDILIEIPKGRKFSLFDLVGVQLDLEKILGKKVDILTYDSIYHLLRKKILNEEVRIL